MQLIFCVQLHKQADMQEEKNRIERVLGAIPAPDLIQRVLNFALSVRKYTHTLTVENRSDWKNLKHQNHTLQECEMFERIKGMAQNTQVFLGESCQACHISRNYCWCFMYWRTSII